MGTKELAALAMQRYGLDECWKQGTKPACERRFEHYSVVLAASLASVLCVHRNFRPRLFARSGDSHFVPGYDLEFAGFTYSTDDDDPLSVRVAVFDEVIQVRDRQGLFFLYKDKKDGPGLIPFPQLFPDSIAQVGGMPAMLRNLHPHHASPLYSAEA